MAGLAEIKSLCAQAEKYQLENREILKKYKNTELSSVYNGIGSDSFPEWLRYFISVLHPSLAVVAMIHDVEWHESDCSIGKFGESNARFKRNGYAVAKAKFGWYDLRRYIVMNQARRFGNICQRFGWDGWITPCRCKVCQKKRGESKNE